MSGIRICALAVLVGSVVALMGCKERAEQPAVAPNTQANSTGAAPPEKTDPKAVTSDPAPKPETPPTTDGSKSSKKIKPKPGDPVAPPKSNGNTPLTKEPFYGNYFLNIYFRVAGGDSGWMGRKADGFYAFRETDNGKPADPQPGDIGAYRFYTRTTLVSAIPAKDIPPTSEPFGLAIHNGTEVDGDLEAIARFKDLRLLNLEGCEELTDKGLKHLAGLTKLESLNVTGLQVSDKGLKHLAGMTKLQALDLSDTKVSDNGLNEIAKHTKLRSLGLASTEVTDKGLPKLAELKDLQFLTLGYNKITDDGLTHLAGLTKLESLWLDGTKVTKTGVAKLQKALPQCKIRW